VQATKKSFNQLLRPETLTRAGFAMPLESLCGFSEAHYQLYYASVLLQRRTGLVSAGNPAQRDGVCRISGCSARQERALPLGKDMRTPGCSTAQERRSYEKAGPKGFRSIRIPDDLCPIATELTVLRTGDWRAERPVVDRDKCVKCATCWTYCPTSALWRKRPGSKRGWRSARGAASAPRSAAPRNYHDGGSRGMTMSRHSFCDGTQAAAWGVALARPDMVAVYPITPQFLAGRATFHSLWQIGIIQSRSDGRGSASTVFCPWLQGLASRCPDLLRQAAVRLAFCSSPTTARLPCDCLLSCPS